MRARKYGSPRPTRAPITASSEAASSEKKYTPGSRPSTCTYVRTLASRNRSPSAFGTPSGRAALTANGFRPM